MTEYVARFALGGMIVTIFSLVADALRPKSFAGLFGAAPSVALASLVLILFHKGSHDAAIQARSMMIGALALWLFSIMACQLLWQAGVTAWKATTLSMVVWFVVAFGCDRLLRIGSL